MPSSPATTRDAAETRDHPATETTAAVTLPKADRTTVLQLLAVVGAWLVAAWWLMRRGLLAYKFTDLTVYHGAIRWWFTEHRPLYDFLIYIGGFELGFTYPPFAALLFAPFAFMGLQTAYVVFTMLAAAAFALISWWLVASLARQRGWHVLTAFGIAAAAIFMMEPVWVTVAIGQVNWLIMVLVLADVIFLLAPGSRWAGVGIGLAAAIKLTPAIFIGYLLITRRFRAALTAVGTAVGATLLSAIVAPTESRIFWTQAIWDTQRVGVYGRVDNQSLMGMIARLTHTNEPSKALWLAAVVGVAAFGAWRAWQAWRDADEIAGITLFGLLSGLVSPVSWIHHLLWFVPAVVICVDVALRTRDTGSRWWLWYAGIGAGLWASTAYVTVWQLAWEGGIVGRFGQNAYALAALALLVLLPHRSSHHKNPFMSAIQLFRHWLPRRAA